MTDNKNIKKGDKIILIKSNNSHSKYEGMILEVVVGTATSSTLTVKNPNGHGTFSVYRSGPADEFVLADKKSLIEFYKNKEKELLEDLKKIRASIDFHVKYDSEEEFVADKIGMLMKANTTEARVEILKTLKQTNLL